MRTRSGAPMRAAKTRNTRAGNTAPSTEKQTTQHQNAQQILQPLRDVTNNVQKTRSRRPRKVAVKPNADTDDEITHAPPLRKTRRGNQSPPHSVPSLEINPPNIPLRTATRQRIAEVEQSSSDEIQPNPPKTITNTAVPAREPPSNEIRSNTVRERRSRVSTLTESSDENQRGYSRNERSMVSPTGRSRARPASPATSESPPISPAAGKPQTETHQSSWADEKRDMNSVGFETKRRRQAIHTYGKRRRVGRISLPTMQDLGVRAKSPNGGSQNGSEKDDGNASDEYGESDDESEDTSKRDPKLEKFVVEQRKLWQEVDEIDLVVESD